jgi:APA family basic amino acid/polyamine antiporter
MNSADPESRLVRAIGLGGATLLVMGNVLGSAIFLTTGIMAEQMPSPVLLLLVWFAGGLLTLAGGLTCAEMGTMYPRSGGWYVFLREAYGPVWGFLFGWAGMLVMLTGSVAAVAVGFAEYFSYFFPALGLDRIFVSFPLAWGELRISAGQVVAAASIAVLGAINYIGVRFGNGFQAILTAIKVALLAAVPALAFILRPVDPQFAPVVSHVSDPLAAFGVAMIAVMWAYSGWDYLSFASGEIKDPARTIPRALILGTLALTALYVLINLGYIFSLSMADMRGVLRIGERAVGAMIGAGGTALVVAGVMISTFGCNASSIIPISRVCFAMSADGLFLRSAAAVHPKYRTPHVSIVLTTAWSAFLTLTGTYEQLYTYVVFTALLFNVAGGIAIFKLRRSRPDVPRPYRTWGYPLVPAVFVLSTAVLVINTLRERPVESFAGLGLVALGLPAYWYWRRNNRESGFRETSGK